MPKSGVVQAGAWARHYDRISAIGDTGPGTGRGLVRGQSGSGVLRDNQTVKGAIVSALAKADDMGFLCPDDLTGRPRLLRRPQSPKRQSRHGPTSSGQPIARHPPSLPGHGLACDEAKAWPAQTLNHHAA